LTTQKGRYIGKYLFAGGFSRRNKNMQFHRKSPRQKRSPFRRIIQAGASLTRIGLPICSWFDETGFPETCREPATRTAASPVATSRRTQCCARSHRGVTAPVQETCLGNPPWSHRASAPSPRSGSVQPRRSSATRRDAGRFEGFVLHSTSWLRSSSVTRRAA
jgi:hypothetical protein